MSLVRYKWNNKWSVKHIKLSFVTLITLISWAIIMSSPLWKNNEVPRFGMWTVSFWILQKGVQVVDVLFCGYSIQWDQYTLLLFYILISWNDLNHIFHISIGKKHFSFHFLENSPILSMNRSMLPWEQAEANVRWQFTVVQLLEVKECREKNSCTLLCLQCR